MTFTSSFLSINILLQTEQNMHEQINATKALIEQKKPFEWNITLLKKLTNE